MSMKTAGVIGGGAWGTALALVCARAGLETTLLACMLKSQDALLAALKPSGPS